MPIFQPPALSIFTPGLGGEGGAIGLDRFQNAVEFLHAATFDQQVSMGALAAASIGCGSLEVFGASKLDGNNTFGGNVGATAIFNQDVQFNNPLNMISPVTVISLLGVASINGVAYPPPTGIKSPLCLHASSFVPNVENAIANRPQLNKNNWLQTGAASLISLFATVPLGVGNIVSSISVNIHGALANTVTLKVWDTTLNSTAPTQIGATQTSALTATDQTLTMSTGFTLAAGHAYTIEVSLGSTVTISLYGGSISFT